MGEVFKHHMAGDGIAWVQPHGPNTEPVPLGCHDIGDVAHAQGDVTIYFCPDLTAVNRWYVAGSYQGAPGPVTTTFETHMTDIRDLLEAIMEGRCGAPLYLNKVRSGRRDVFLRYARSFVIPTMRVTNHTMTAMGARDPSNQGPTMQSFDVSGDNKYPAFELQIQRQETTETESLNTITSCNGPACWDAKAGPAYTCDHLYAGGDTLAGSASNTADVIEQTDGDGDWDALAADPFAAGMVIAAVRCFDVGRDTTRIIALRGTTDAGPADIAYSDDNGATWIGVAVGATNGEYFIGHRSIYVAGPHAIWVVTDQGYIYFSSDGGESWDAQEEGILSGGGALNAIDGLDDARLISVGDSDVILFSDDGETWYASAAVTGTGDNLLSCAIVTQYRAWVTTDAGDLYFTHDGGDVWTQRAGWVGSGTGEVRDIAFVRDPIMRVHCGFMVHDSVAPLGQVLHTIDGGFNWEELDTPLNAGLNAIHVCDCNTAFVAGEAQGGTAVILKVSGGAAPGI